MDRRMDGVCDFSALHPKCIVDDVLTSILTVLQLIFMVVTILGASRGSAAMLRRSFAFLLFYVSMQLVLLLARRGVAAADELKAHLAYETVATLEGWAGSTATAQAAVLSAAALRATARPQLLQAGEALAGALATRRTYFTFGAGGGGGGGLALEFDPRFLVFEFVWNLLLRPKQVEIVEQRAAVGVVLYQLLCCCRHLI